MFTVAFLAWLFAWLKTVIRERVREVVAGRYAAGTLSVATVTKDVYPMVRACSYVYYMAALGMARAELGEGMFTPSMSGVSEKQVERMVREELRLRNGQLVGNVTDVADRLTESLSTVVAENERQAARDLAGERPGRVEGSERYTKEHGNPVARVVVAQERDQWWQDVRRQSPELEKAMSRVREMWVAEFGDVPAVPVEDMEAFKDWVAPIRERAIEDMRTRVERDRAEVELVEERWADEEAEREWREIEDLRKAVIEAEIFLGYRDKNGNVRPPASVSKLPRTPQGHVMAGGWARVPVGAYTCGFCLLLCSRGAVYHKHTVTKTPRRLKRGLAPMIGAYGQQAYHPHCDCIGVFVGQSTDYAGKDIVEGAQALYGHWLDADPEQGGWYSGAKAGVFDTWVRNNRDLVKKLVPSAADNLDIVRLVREIENNPNVRAWRARNKTA